MAARINADGRVCPRSKVCQTFKYSYVLVRSSWNFNKPLEMEMKALDSKRRKTVQNQDREREYSVERLSNISQALYYNSDVLGRFNPIKLDFILAPSNKECLWN